MSGFHLLTGSASVVLPQVEAESVHCCVTSPPYWGLRDYGVEGQIGMENTPQEYVDRIVGVFREVWRVLREDGTLWLNVGDSFATDGKWGGATGGKHVTALHGQAVGRERRNTGLKPKNLVGIPWRVAFALQADGWYLRSDIIWHKPNPMPESVTDRPTRAHEYIFLLTKNERYYYDHEAIKEPRKYAGPNGQQHSPYAQGFGRRTKEQEAERQDKQRGHSRRHAGFNARWDAMSKTEQSQPGRNKRSVWTVATCATPEDHFATYPPDLIEPCILAGCPERGTVLDPFAGAGTTGLAALKNGRNFLGIELNPEYVKIAEGRGRKFYPLLMGASA